MSKKIFKNNNTRLERKIQQDAVKKALDKAFNSPRNQFNPKSLSVVKNRGVRSLPDIRKPVVHTESIQEFNPAPMPTLIATPDWFTSKGEHDVSIIVPLYKSQSVIADQINSWDLSNDGLKKEIIYVDDCCPNKTFELLVNLWAARTSNSVGKIIRNENNSGYGRACNVGAKYATGKYLIFLNADCVVTPNWIKPLFDRMESNNKIGIAGNMQMNHVNGTVIVDSAGSEWSWETENFDHIARNVHKGKRLYQPMALDNAPADIFEAGEREMVTGCCFIIPKNLFIKLNGFDDKFLIGYYEDSDLSMKVQQEGYKIYYEPNSRIYHKGGHTGSGGHPYMLQNRKTFFNKWVNNGIIDKYVKAKRPNPLVLESVYFKRSVANGDVLAAAGVAAAIKKKFPNCRVAFETLVPQVLKNNPYIDHVVPNPNPNAYHEPPLGLSKNYQFVCDFDKSYENRPKVNLMQSYADLAGVDVRDCKLFMHSENVSILPKNYICMHAGWTAWVGRNWHKDKFAEIARRLMEMKIPIVLIGQGGDSDIPNVTLNLKNRTNIFQMAYVIKNAKLFVGIDSFPFWIAQAFKTPAVTFFGCILPELRILNNNVTGINAKDLPCIGCHHDYPPPCQGTSHCKIGSLLCEEKITVDHFMAEIKNYL